MVRLLVEAGADLEARTNQGSTPFLQAAYGGRPALLELLGREGSDVNAVRPASGQTALAWAVAEGRRELAEHLLELGARPHEEASSVASDGAGTLDADLLPLRFHLRGDRQPWSVEGAYEGTVSRDGRGLLVRLESGVIWARAEHGAPVVVGEIRAALGRRDGASWNFHAASRRTPVGRRLEPGDWTWTSGQIVPPGP